MPSRTRCGRRPITSRRPSTCGPNYAEAHNNLGIVFVRQQDFSRAEEQFKSGIRVAPNFDQSYLNLARLYAMRNDKEKARAVLQDLLRMQPDNPGAKQALELLQ